MPNGTITSTSNTFGSISGDVGANVPGTLSGSVGVPGPQGIQGPVGPQGPQGVPGVGGAWGSIVGTLSAQVDLWTELGTKYPASNPSGFITSTALTPYLTSATAASTYQPISGMTAYLTTASAASTYAPIAAGLPAGGTVGQVLTKNSGTSWDDSWQTIIPGDRYLTSSTTSLTIDNNNKTLTVGTGLSYSSQQDIVITHNASNHMHARVLTYNSGTGVMDVDVLSHSGAGTYATWTVNVGGAPALASVVWGDITGTLGAQGDLAAALGNKLETSDAASTYQTIAGMSSYLTTADAATTYYLNTNPDAFITASALSGYATESWVGSQGYLTSGSLSGYLTTVDAASTYLSIVDAASAYLTIVDAASAYQPISGMSSYLTTSAADSSYYPLTGNPSAFITSASLSGYALLSGATFTGKVNTVASATGGAGFNVPHGAAPTSPVNGDIWTTTTGLFMRQNGATQQYVSLSETQTISGNKTFSNANLTLGNSTAAGTINVGTGATVSGSTRTINIGTASAAGSTNAINIGGGSGTSTVTFGGNIGGTFTRTGGKTNFAAPAAGYASVNFTPGPDPTTLATGDVWYDSLTNKLKLRAGFVDPLATESYISGLASNATPLVNGTASAGSSFNFSRNDHVHPTDTSRAPTASPALTGTPTSTTAAADTNTTQIATTAYVVGQSGSATPLVDGTAAVGTSLRYARQDHVHPTDTSRAALASPTFTGVPAAPTAAVDTNTTQLATTAYVVGQGYLKSATASTTYAPLASAALTGVPTAPTATAGTNTTQLATTAFVTAAVPALATLAESRQFTNDTKVMSPRDVLWSMLSQDFIDIDGPSMTTTTVGTITSVQVGQLSRSIRPGNAGACSCRIRTFGASQVDQTWNATSRAQPSSFLNFSLRSIHSGRSTTAGVTDANYTCAVYYGKAEADGVGDLIRRGYGWKMVGGAGSRFLQLQAHNGTTLSSVTSSFAVTAGVAFDWDIESDGAGNVTLYVNGSSVATSTGGPTGAVNITAVAWQEEVVAAAALSSPFMDFTNSRGRFIVINSW